MILILLGPDGQDIHRQDCEPCEGEGRAIDCGCDAVTRDRCRCSYGDCPTCSGSGLVRVPGCGCAKCEAERAREGVGAVVP